MVLAGMAGALGFCIMHKDSAGADMASTAKLMAAFAAYSDSLRAQHLPMPPTVNSQELIERGLLNEEDLRRFGAEKLTISLALFGQEGTESYPGLVLMQAELSDGTFVVLLGDGSVQAVRKGRIRGGQLAD